MFIIYKVGRRLIIYHWFKGPFLFRALQCLFYTLFRADDNSYWTAYYNNPKCRRLWSIVSYSLFISLLNGFIIILKEVFILHVFCKRYLNLSDTTSFCSSRFYYSLNQIIKRCISLYINQHFFARISDKPTNKYTRFTPI